MKSITRRVGLRKKPNIVSCGIGNVLSLRHFPVFCSFNFIYLFYLCFLFVYNFELCHIIIYSFIYLLFYVFLCYCCCLFVCFSFLFYKKKYIENCEINVVLLSEVISISKL